MKKTHLEILSQTFYNFNKEALAQGNKITELFDNIIVWIIGLATSSIVLIFSSLDKLNFIGKNKINVTIGILVGSILLGILGRVFYAIAVYLGSYLMQILNLQISMLTFPHKNKPLLGTETSQEVYHILLEDFKIEVPSLLIERKNFTTESLRQIDENARNFYKQYFEWSQEALEHSFDQIKQITLDTLGYRKNHFEKNKGATKWKGKFLRFLTKLSYVLYVLSILSFGCGVLYFFLQFLESQK